MGGLNFFSSSHRQHRKGEEIRDPWPVRGRDDPAAADPERDGRAEALLPWTAPRL
jgi:hypothetical protein